MTTPRPPHHDAPGHDHDWLAQERALSRPATAHDALLARALRTQPRPQPPADFADATLRHVQARVRQATRDDARFERGLLNALLAVLAVSSAGAVLVYGGQWWAWAAQALGGEAAQWAVAGAACLALSAGLRALLSVARDVPTAARV